MRLSKREKAAIARALAKCQRALAPLTTIVRLLLIADLSVWVNVQERLDNEAPIPELWPKEGGET